MKKKIITVLLALLVGGLVVTTLASCAGDKVPSNPPAIANL